MKVSEHEQIGGRWSEYATSGVEDWEVVFASEDGDYQGSCEFIARSPDGSQYMETAWSWGSCSGCDPWEDEPHEVVEAEFLANREYYGIESLKATLATLEALPEPDYAYYWYNRPAKIEALRAEVARVEG